MHAFVTYRQMGIRGSVTAPEMKQNKTRNCSFRVLLQFVIFLEGCFCDHCTLSTLKRTNLEPELNTHSTSGAISEVGTSLLLLCSLSPSVNSTPLTYQSGQIYKTRSATC